MEHGYYDQYFYFEQDNWWFVSRRRIFMRLLRRRFAGRGEIDILDAGCGTGINLRYLRELGQVVGVDNAAPAIGFCRRSGERAVVHSDLTSLAVDDECFDLVTAFDVLEHVDDDAAAVRELLRVLRPGGTLMVSVPALPGLWSEHDEINHHKRRYRRQELLALLAGDRCVVDRVTYLNTFLLPVAYAVRTWQRLRRRLAGPPRRPARTDFIDYHPVLNLLLATAFTAEIPLLVRCNLPVGLSLLCMARKTEG